MRGIWVTHRGVSDEGMEVMGAKGTESARHDKDLYKVSAVWAGIRDQSRQMFALLWSYDAKGSFQAMTAQSP